MKTYYDIEGDGGSRVVEQVEAQQARVAGNLARVRRRLAVGSGKGGVGKSTLTAQLGRAFAARGRRVAILDADLNGPTQARLTGLQAVPLLPGEEGLLLPRTAEGMGVVSLGSVVPESEAVDFPSVAAGDSFVWRATREFALLAQLLGSVEWGELDYLLVDLPPGAERTLQFAEALGEETLFLLVTVPSDLARGVVARSLAALEKTPNRVLGYVENMKGYYCADCGSVKPLFPESAGVELGIPCLGNLPFDPQLAARCDRGLGSAGAGEPASSTAIRDLASKIEQAVG